MHSGKCSLKVIIYMRWCLIYYKYISIEKVQKVRSYEIKILISQGDIKIILIWVHYQINLLYFNFNQNNLAISNKKFKGQSIVGSRYLKNSKQSELFSRLLNNLL